VTKDCILNVQGREILLSSIDDLEYISITDMAKDFWGNDQIKNWIRTTIEYLGTWETINNSDFNMVEFHHVKMATTSESFIISPTQWIKRTNAEGWQIQEILPASMNLPFCQIWRAFIQY